MSITTALFYFFAAVLLGASFRVITARSTVHAVLFLILAFFNAACIWLMLGAEFLAITLVLVYIGAVMVLFLFVVMMLDAGSDRIREGFWKHLPLAVLLAAFITLEMAAVLLGGFRVSEVPALSAQAVQHGNAKMLGIELYTHYVYPVQLAAVLLLIAIIAAIALTLRRRKDSRSQDVSEQLRANKADRLRIVKMSVFQEPSADPVAPPEGAEPPKGAA